MIHSLGGGGAEKILVNIANGLDPAEFDVTVMSIVDSGYHRSHLNKDVNYKSLFSYPFRQGKQKDGELGTGKSGSLLAGRRKLKKPLEALYYALWKIAPVKLLYRLGVREQYDVEIAFLEGICAKYIAASTNRESRKLCWIHVDVLKEKKSHRAFRSFREEKDCYCTFDEIIGVSKGVIASFAAYLGTDSKDYHVLRNPLDIKEIERKSQCPVDPKDEALFDKFTFCSIGRLCEQKAFDRLIHAASILKAEGLDFTVIVLGEGKLEEDLSQLIERLDLQGTVRLLGFKENPYPYLARSNGYVCTSLAEGMSTTVSEAIVVGLPIVATNCAGMEELMEIAQGSIVGGDPKEIAEGMKTLMKNAQNDFAPSNDDAVSAFFDFDQSMGLIEQQVLG